MSSFHFFLIMLINLAWGFNFLAAKTAMDYFPPFLVLFFRFSLLLIILLPFLKIPKNKILPVSLLSFISGVLYFSINFLGLDLAGELTSPAIATQLFIPFGAILAFFFLREKIKIKTWLAIFIAFLGVMILGFDETVFDNLLSLLLITISAIPMAITTILMRKLKGVNTFQIQAWTGLVAIIPYIFLSIIFEKDHWSLIISAPLEPVLSILYSVIAASLIGHGLLYYLLTRYQVSLVNPMLLLSPVFASFFGIFFRGDSLTWYLIIGGVLTLSGVAIISFGSKIDKKSF